jgi:hypothetical protein
MRDFGSSFPRDDGQGMIAEARDCHPAWPETPLFVILAIGHLNFSLGWRWRYHN